MSISEHDAAELKAQVVAKIDAMVGLWICEKAGECGRDDCMHIKWQKALAKMDELLGVGQ